MIPAFKAASMSPETEALVGAEMARQARAEGHQPTPTERKRRGPKRASVEVIRSEILAVLPEGEWTTLDLARHLRRNKDYILAALKILEADGLAVVTKLGLGGNRRSHLWRAA